MFYLLIVQTICRQAGEGLVKWARQKIVTAWTRASEMAKAKGSMSILPASVDFAIRMHLERDLVKSTARCRSCE